jgi:hypothetical protein
MKMTFDTLIEEFSNKNNYSKYQYIPFVQFRELKYYNYGSIESIIKNNIDPLLIFLDGLDELNEPTRIKLNKEIQNILSTNSRVRFIISGRNSSFVELGIFNISSQLYLEKYFDSDDMELTGLMEEYKNTPITDLLTIPTYRIFILEKKISKNTKLQEFYNLLVKENLLKDKERRDLSNNISSRNTPDIDIDIIIEKISEFCCKLFIEKRIVFTENELKRILTNKKHFILMINSSIIDYNDENNISFISNFYYEYFVSNALLTKDKKSIIQIFFTRGKIRIPLIDILVLFLSCAKTKSKGLHDFLMKKILKDSIVYILLCEFDSISDSERYNYFISIFNLYKREKKNVYYGRFRQRYGPLKNIDNMARRMQQLLPNCYKTECVNFLKTEIINYLQYPSKDDISSFGNAVILLIPFIDDLWTEKEQIILYTLSLPLIKYFLYDDRAYKLKGLLSERFIFDWYMTYNWVTEWKQKEWELFYKNISGNDHDLSSEISDENEFAIKFNFFSCFHNNDIIKPLLSPLLHYAMKNKYIHGHGKATYVPEMITDDYETPLIQEDDRIFALSYLLRKIELRMSEILDLLVFSIENNLYRKLKDSHSNLISILEKKLYNNIGSLDDKDYKKLSRYYFDTNEHRFSDKLFKEIPKSELENIKKIFVYEVIERDLKKWDTGLFLSRLIDFISSDHSLEYLALIKEKMSRNIYADTVYYIFDNKEHILNSSEIIIGEYNTLFEKEILKTTEKKKMLELKNIEIKESQENDLKLMMDQEAMITELKKINNFVLNQFLEDKEETTIGKLHSLNHESIIDMISYRDNYCIPPIFSECAIKILEYFYRDETFDIDKIIKILQDYLFKEEKFYIYFYWIFINKTRDIENTYIKYNTNPELTKKILGSMNNDASYKFINESLEFFENNNQWLTPFFYYYETLLNNNHPEWMKTDYILKLTVVPDPFNRETPSNDISLDWLIEKFPIIKPCQIIEYGLNIIENVKNYYSRMQIVKYFIDYYNTNKQDALKNEILDFIINTTKRLFNLTINEHEFAEFQHIGHFWSECGTNHIDHLFPKFTVEIITSAIRKNENDFDYQYRKDVLLYCVRITTFEQKTRIIHEIESDSKNKTLSDNESDEIYGFLASLGREKSIKFIINSYLRGKAIQSSFSYNGYPLGFLKQNCIMLKYFIDLFIYSTDKSTERRKMLKDISQNGIKQHLTKKTFKTFERKIIKEIRKSKKQSSWKAEYFEEYLLQMEQSVYS